MDPEIERQFYDEIIRKLQESDITNFDEALTAFELAFKHAADVHNQPYSEENEARGRSLFFSPFTKEEYRWRYSVEIFSTPHRYVVFDRNGGFAIYENNGLCFGDLTFSNKPNQAIEELAGLIATDLIASLIQAHEQIAILQTRLSNINRSLTAKESAAINRRVGDNEEEFDQ